MPVGSVQELPLITPSNRKGEQIIQFSLLLFKSFDNLAERTICKLTIQRNNSFHYGSDAGVEMAATYHSVISTIKLHGSSVWDFLGTFFQKVFNGYRNFVNMTPDKIF